MEGCKIALIWADALSKVQVAIGEATRPNDDVIFIPPGVEHAIYNAGITDPRFVLVTAGRDE